MKSKQCRQRVSDEHQRQLYPAREGPGVTPAEGTTGPYQMQAGYEHYGAWQGEGQSSWGEAGHSEHGTYSESIEAPLYGCGKFVRYPVLV